jgi:hypothetical protein
MQPITLSFHGKSVKLITLLDQLKTLPLIDVRFDELAKENRYANRGRPIEDNEEEISVFKVDGYYVVLTGKSALEKIKTGQSFQARLLSKHALKHMQAITIDAPVVAAVKPMTKGKPQQAALLGGNA